MRYISAKEYRSTDRHSAMMCSESLADVSAVQTLTDRVPSVLQKQTIAEKPV